jgi:kynurenine formamidase
MSDELVEQITLMGEQVRNWGRWGEDDEAGTLNLITSQKRRDAAGLVRRGDVFSLCLPLGPDGPQAGSEPPRPLDTTIQRSNPIHFMVRTGTEEASHLGATCFWADDAVTMYLQAGTQWDALSHIFYGGQVYNGRPSSVIDESGAHSAGIDKQHDKFVGRGVLLDVARLHGVPSLPSGHAITTEELEGAEKQGGIEVTEGDMVLVRTGLMSTWKSSGDWSEFMKPQPGLHFSCAKWLHARGAAAVAADNTAVEASSSASGLYAPFHMLALRDMGLPIGEYWYLEDLAADCAGDGVSEFFLVAQALPFEAALGSPTNPIAIK